LDRDSLAEIPTLVLKPPGAQREVFGKVGEMNRGDRVGVELIADAERQVRVELRVGGGADEVI
jgi:hypothetical protein